MGVINTSEKMLSKKFSLADLTITTQRTPNIPDSSSLANLHSLAALLDRLYDQIGPFKIVSGYRSQDTQDALKNSGNNQAVEKSLHTLGMAVDIAPTKMSAEKYMTSILSSNLRSQCGQIALKKTVLHLSLPVPEKGFVGTAMLVLADGKYYRQSESWIDGLKNKYGYAVKIISDNAEKLSAVATQKPVAISLGALVIGAALLAALSSSKGKAI